MPSKSSSTVLHINPRSAGKALAVGIFILLVLNCIFYAREWLGLSGFLAYGLLPQFNFEGEGTLPSYVSSLLLLTAAALLGLASAGEQDRTQRWMWIGLAAVFVYLSIDEAISLHELASKSVEKRLGPSPWLNSGWVVPAGVLTGLLGLIYIRFLLRLPRRYALWFIVAGALYVGGALGGELVGSRVISAVGAKTVLYVLVMTTEETLQMTGVSVFIVGLTSYLAAQGRAFILEMGSGVNAAPVLLDPLQTRPSSTS